MIKELVNNCSQRHSMSWPRLTPEQAVRAEKIYQQLREYHDEKLRELAILLTSKPDHQLLGQTEFEVGDIVQDLRNYLKSPLEPTGSLGFS